MKIEYPGIQIFWDIAVLSWTRPPLKLDKFFYSRWELPIALGAHPGGQFCRGRWQLLNLWTAFGRFWYQKAHAYGAAA